MSRRWVITVPDSPVAEEARPSRPVTFPDRPAARIRHPSPPVTYLDRPVTDSDGYVF